MPGDEHQSNESGAIRASATAAAPGGGNEPAASLGTNIVGNGPADGFGLGRKDTGIFSGQGGGGGQGTGNRFGSYFSQVKEALSDALRGLGSFPLKGNLPAPAPENTVST